MNPKFTYLLLDLVSVFFPIVGSFDRKVHFYRYWWRLFPAMLVGGATFLIWDEWFTAMKVWHFNPKYILGTYIGHLPLEEWLFFFCIPFSCLFIYECVKAYFRDYLQPYAGYITVVFILAFVALALIYREQIYTLITFTGAAIMLIFHYLIFGTRYLGRFYLMWAIHLIPLFIVNGFLTGIPVVEYNDSENMGIRIGTVPFEDSFYSMLILLINITVYEWLGERFGKSRKSLPDHDSR